LSGHHNGLEGMAVGANRSGNRVDLVGAVTGEASSYNFDDVCFSLDPIYLAFHFRLVFHFF